MLAGTLGLAFGGLARGLTKPLFLFVLLIIGVALYAFFKILEAIMRWLPTILYILFLPVLVVFDLVTRQK